MDPLMDKGIGGRHMGIAIIALARGMEAFVKAIAPVGSGPDSFERAVVFASTVLIAQDSQGQAVGAVAVRPCVGSVMTTMESYPAKFTELGVKGLAGTAKLVALAVIPEARSQGIGRILLDAVVEHYRLAGTPMIYGIIEEEKAAELVPFYERSGFRVLEPGRILDLSHIYGVQSWVRSDPEERYFYLDLKDPASRRWEAPKLTYPSESSTGTSSVQGQDPPEPPETAQPRSLWGHVKNLLFPNS
jgi:GNAT superfamily N-acetyltransferase